MFDIYTNADEYDFIWECCISGCGRTNICEPRTSPRKAFKDAVKHAQECLTDLRTRQGTDTWPLDYTVDDFMSDCMSIKATAPAIWSRTKANRKS